MPSGSGRGGPRTVPRFERTDAASGPLVRGYADGGFIVDGERFTAVLMTPERAFAFDGTTPDALTMEQLAPVLALEPAPEFVLFGTGARLVRPPVALVKALEARGIGVEAMDSRAAARTWGVLRSEERWIAAALLPL
jgi:uncharacterized protein